MVFNNLTSKGNYIKIITVSLCFFILECFLYPVKEKELTLTEFREKFLKTAVKIDAAVRIPTLLVDESQIYVCEKGQSEIHIFDKLNGKELKVIGRKGEGPQEFIYIVDLYLSKDSIYVTSPQKLSIFTKSGMFIKEHRIPYFYDGAIIPFGDNYIYYQYLYDTKSTKPSINIVYSFMDSNFKKTKTIFKVPYTRPPSQIENKTAFEVFHHCRETRVYKNNFYLADTELGFYIAVFDITGNKLYEINQDYDKVPIDNKVREMVEKNIRARDRENRFFSRRYIYFKEYFPAFVNFFIYDDKIFVFKYLRPGSKGYSELVVLNLKGNLLAKKDLPLGSLTEILGVKNEISYFNGEIYFYADFDEYVNIFKLSLDELYRYYFGTGTKRN